MDKKICAFIFSVAFISMSGIVHSNSKNIQRAPFVDTFVEVDIQDIKNDELNANTGFNFTNEQKEIGNNRLRLPANIVSKSETNSPTSYIGPILFLIALPIGLWIMVSKKFSKGTNDFLIKNEDDSQSGSKKNDDNDMDYPKAS